jgi:hypothetical protein
MFKHLPSAHNVPEVNKEDYTTYNSLNPIADYNQGGMRIQTTIFDHVSSIPLLPDLPPTSPELLLPLTRIIP